MQNSVHSEAVPFILLEAKNRHRCLLYYKKRYRRLFLLGGLKCAN